MLRTLYKPAPPPIACPITYLRHLPKLCIWRIRRLNFTLHMGVANYVYAGVLRHAGGIGLVVSLIVRTCLYCLTCLAIYGLINLLI